MDYGYDNSAQNPANPAKPPVRVRFGQRSRDEMGTLTLALTLADAEARRWLQRSLLRHDLTKAPEAGNLWLELAGLERERGDHAQSAAALQQAEKFHPDQAQVQAEWGIWSQEIGLDVFGMLKERNESVLVIQMSGYSEMDAAMKQGMELSATAYFNKPLDIDAVLATIHDAIEHPK